MANNIIDSIHHELDTLGMKNIIVIGSEDNVFVTDLLSKLHACRDTGMVVYGLPDEIPWGRKNIECQYVMRSILYKNNNQIRQN